MYINGGVVFAAAAAVSAAAAAAAAARVSRSYFLLTLQLLRPASERHLAKAVQSKETANISPLSIG